MNLEFNSEPSNKPHQGSPQGDTSGNRPVHPVPVSYTTSWMYFLLVLCLLVAWYYPAQILVTRLLWPPPAEEGVRDAKAFATLAYEGVSFKENEVLPSRFREHIDVMKENGYVPIGLNDVYNLLYHGEPVPRKAVLLTFDHGRRTSYFQTKGHLRRTGWRGVMFLWTRPIEERDGASLLWPYVRSLVRARNWEIGAQSHHGFDPVITSPGGRTDRFMTSPKWLLEEDRFEMPSEYKARIAGDHQKTLELIEDRSGTRPRAYAYPYGDFGQYQGQAAFMRRANLALASRYYDLAFISGNLPVNTVNSDPHRLNRLRVRPGWSGEELVDYLERAWPSEDPMVAEEEGGSPNAWIVDWGGMDPGHSGLRLHATDRTTGAKMWLAGSDMSKDFHAKIRFQLIQGQLGVYMRATPDEESYVYLGIDSRGDMWLREKTMGSDVGGPDDILDNDLSIWLRQKRVALDRFTLASGRRHLDLHAEHELEIFIRDRLMYVLINGEPLFDDRIQLRGDPKPGMLGLSIWDPDRGSAAVDIHSASLMNQEPKLAKWSARDFYSPYIARWVHQNAFRLTQISPPWLSVSPIGQINRERWDEEVFDRLSKIYHLKLTPQVYIDEEEWLQRLRPSQLADEASNYDVHGLYVNMSEMRNPTATVVGTWLQQCGRELQERGLDLLVSLPSMLERPAALNSLLAIVPNMQVVTAGQDAFGNNPRTQDVDSVELEEVPDPDPDLDWPLYYEIMAIPEDLEDAAPEARAVSLDQNGRAAFLEGDYRRAISLWEEWHEIEPSNPRPLMLIGDAYVRLNNPAMAISYYDRSLDIDPGQISLAIRQARIMAREGMDAEAVEMLNLYGRLFPDNPRILMAQAEWLLTRDRYAEARELAEKVIEVHPSNLDALMMMIRISERHDERVEYVRRLQEFWNRPEAHYELGRAIWDNDLLSLPEAHFLMPMISRIARDSDDERVRTLYRNLAGRTSPVTENFTVTGALSDSWWLMGGDQSVSGGRLRLRAESGRTEVALRLLGSERIRDGYISASVRNVRGSFWLYARRTANQMLRYGFDEPGRLHLQVWKEGRLVTSRRSQHTWDETDAIRLKLEVRGTGMMGFVDGEPAFDSPVAVPSELWLGWYGLAAFDERSGSASATMEHLSAGPIPMRTVILPSAPGTSRTDDILTSLRDEVYHITDLSPRWFTVRQDGEWVDTMGEDDRLFRMFARYHRLRLLPTVEVMTGRDRAVIGIIEQAKRHNLDGFVLLFDEMPTEQWFQEMREKIDLSLLDVIVVVPGTERDFAEYRALGSAVDLLKTDGETVPVTMIEGPLDDPTVRDSWRELSSGDSAALFL